MPEGKNFRKGPEMTHTQPFNNQTRFNEAPKVFGSSINSYPDPAFEITKDDDTPNDSPSANEANTEFDSSPQLITELDLTKYKVFPCTTRTKHDHKRCPYYHYPKDRRRPTLNYSSDLCEYADRPEKCPKGDSCPKAHSRAEQLYTPEKYRTKFCSFYPDRTNMCEFREYCSFAHDPKQIRIKLIETLERDDDFYMFHYKTVFCPYNLTEHDKTICVYAHNWQDYRRKLKNSLNYDCSLCPEWKTSEFVKSYEEGGCRNNEKCTKSHGWKESEFHPMNYKTKKCTLKKCLGGKICPYYHQENERRILQKDLGAFFVLAPRNRLNNESKAMKAPPTENLTHASPYKVDNFNSDFDIFSNTFERLIQKDDRDQAQHIGSNLSSPKHDFFPWNDFSNLNYTIPQTLNPEPFIDHKAALFGTKEVNTHSKKNSLDITRFSPREDQDGFSWEGMFANNGSQEGANKNFVSPQKISNSNIMDKMIIRERKELRE